MLAHVRRFWTESLNAGHFLKHVAQDAESGVGEESLAAIINTLCLATTEDLAWDNKRPDTRV